MYVVVLKRLVNRGRRHPKKQRTSNYRTMTSRNCLIASGW